MNNIVYIWLSLCVKVDYFTYINLCKIFKDEYELYNLSKNKDKFFKKVKSSKIYISYIIYSKLIDSNLKKKAEIIYSNIKSDNIKVININSKKYPEKLKNTVNPPIILFVYGDISLLNKNKVVVYTSDKKSYIYYEFCNYLNMKNVSIVDYDLNEFTNILFTSYIKKIDRKNLVVISDKLEKDTILNYECLIGISDFLVITKSSYNIKIGIMVDLILEQGKEILTFINDIYDKEAYFSNFLIKSGCNFLTDKKDIDYYI